MNSKIILCKGIKLDRNYVNVLSYDENQMLDLCITNKISTAENFTFIERNKKIRVPFHYSECVMANYIAFQNPDYSNKWFFAFVENIEYKGNMNTEISFKIDSWSTWFSDWTKKPCFVEREHVSDDTIGLHTIPENIDVGEVIETFESYDESYDDTYGFWVAIESSYLIYPNSTETSFIKGIQFSGVSVYNKCIFGNKIFLFKILTISDFLNVSRFVNRTNKDGHIADIRNMWIVPNAVVVASDLTEITASVKENDVDVNFTYYNVGDNITTKKFNTTINKVHNFTGLTIKNNKCFVYPYNYLLVTNNQGNENIYKYEDFSTTNCVFENALALSVGISGRLIPKNYKGMTYANDESIPLAKYPTCAWSSDAYTNWLTLNAVNIPTKIVSDVVSSAVSFGNGNAGNLMSNAGEIASLIGGFRQASLLPNIEGGQNTGDVAWSNQQIKFIFRGFRAKNEYITTIDDYFTRFGYKINKLKIPNITGRTYWNYVEIGNTESIGFGDVPVNFMDEINNACRNGVTIWHNHDNIGNFNLDNSIVNN